VYIIKTDQNNTATSSWGSA